ncbi:MAG TPA: MbcA/ParS/Xre antitoxin family protein [Lacibacter sp.]|nr:MbcA/ParS/Xre antitoxin family protein [Lacibacter sp.]HMO89078.1 MbcA/ParS/Xre antitoxin family protein [Lacibacter sp.]HMP86371.1 MbcA/ParS/Xre antitoxin family protein [Lacibacter sp.]
MAGTKKHTIRKKPLTSVADEPAVAYEPLQKIPGATKASASQVYSTADLIRTSRHGVRKASLLQLSKQLGITMEKMSSLLHTSLRNLQRKEDNALLDPLKSERVLELTVFAQRGSAVLGSLELFQQWLQRPLPALDNQQPLELLDTSFGLQQVRQLLGRLEQGVYS